jgi:hypothetical protein
MTKYNLHDIMNNAWRIFRNAKAGHGSEVIFASALKKAWNMAKTVAKEAAAAAERAVEAAKRESAGVVRMHYSQYKNEYSNCQTVDGSYDKKTKTIEVMTKVARVFERRPSVTAIRGLCPRCHTYCYGDCMAR